jgi:biotin carboxylase
VFIGPSPESLDLFGDKAREREVAARAGAPVIEGAVVRSVEEARAFFAAT